MKVTGIKTAVLQANFEWVLIKVETDEGIIGLGEAHWGFGVNESIQRLESHLMGEDPLHINYLWEKMYRIVAGTAWQGAFIAAISGVEIALWDILGKYSNLPVWQLLGGKQRDHIRILADLHAGASYKPGDGTKVNENNVEDVYTPEAYASHAEDAVERGYDAIKFDIDIPTLTEKDPMNHVLYPAQFDAISDIVSAVRAAVGRTIDIAIDCHWHYNTSDAVRVARSLEPYDLLWLEDPVRPENVDAMKKVTDATSTPICTGENLYMRYGFRDLLEKQAADIIEPDFPRSGGISEIKRIAEAAESYYVPFAPHNVGGPIATVAAAHVCSVVPNFLVLEFHADDVPWFGFLVKGDGPVINKGYITLSNKPGLGLELNEEVAYSHVKPGEGNWFE
ncbi:mandelate racemase/muconate lactonizing enzyme family protein [Salibacterium aidingense]|uniref:mandelate racemase/muconate lactonizing enzyme family protein n=1 Tax=Salibacterium aidingense TaxID=384933 RepID=UPI0004010F11|nr:mandelate racemase/muconate lactonizing enzyme family protein [Salibacterium aidingense]